MPGPWEKYGDVATTSAKPWEKYQQPAIETVKPTELESAGRGAVQGGSFGFGDELEGGAKALWGVLSGPDKMQDIVDKYRQYRDEARSKNALAQETNPKSYFGGELAGGLGSALIPGVGALNAAKGATTAARVGSAALGGGILGAVGGLGSSTADLTKGEFGKAAEDVKTGAETGAAVGGIATPLFEKAVGGLSRFISPENLKDIAADRAVKATTGQKIDALRKISDSTISGQDVGKTQEALRKTGRDLVDSGVIGPFDKVEDLAPKLAAKRREVGAQIGEVGKTIDEKFPQAVSGKNISQQVMNYAAEIPETEGGKALQGRLMKEAQNFENMGQLSFADAQKLKNQFKYKPVDQDALISNQDAVNKIQRIISGEMDDTAQRVASQAGDEGKQLIDQYGNLKGQYRSFKLTGEAASDRALKNLSNRYVSPSDYGVGAVGAMAHSIGHGGGVDMKTAVVGLAAAGLNKLARERGSSFASYSLTKAANALENSPEFAQKFGSILESAAQRGGPSLAITHELLSKNDPDYMRYLKQGETENAQ